MRHSSAVAIVTVLVAATVVLGPPAGATIDGARSCTPAVDGSGATPGDTAPAFTLRTLDRGCVRLAALRGSPVVVNFWASWCHPCRTEFPDLRAAYTKHHDADGLEMIGVASRDIRSDARQFAREQHADWTLAGDTDDGIVAHAYRVNPLPETVFIRPDGKVTAHVYGALSKKELAKELAKILPRPDVAQSSGSQTSESG